MRADAARYEVAELEQHVARLAGMLRELGCRVTEAGDGEEAVARIRRAPAQDAAVIDFAMPGMNGGQTAAALWALCPGLPVVLMSGYADLEALDEAWSGPVLRKPFNLGDLARELARVALEGRSVPQQGQ